MSGFAIILSLLATAASAGGLIVAALAYRRSGRAVDAAERSAAAAERSAEATMSSAEIERRRSAAQLALVVLKTEGDGMGGGRAVFAIRNDGGSPATRVAPKEIVVGGDVIFSVGGVAESIAPGDSAQFEGRSVAVAHRLERAAIKSVEYVDALGPHDVELLWSRTV